MFNWILGQLRKGCRKIVCSWKSSEFKSTESCEKAPRPQPNSVFAQFSVVCMFNWMLGQLKKGCGKVVYSWKSSELESAEPCEARKISPSAQFSIRAILSRVYVQLDVRPVEEGYREVVYSWKSSELESAEQCEGKSIKSHPRPNSVFAQFSVVCIFNWMLGQLKKAVGKSFFKRRSYIRGKALNLNRLSRARKN